MVPAKACTFLLIGLAAIQAPGTAPTQDTAAGARELTIAGNDGQPSFSVRIWAEGAKGLVAVRDENGRAVQRLTCPLLRDAGEVTPGELAAVREQFVMHFMIADLDSDGHADLAGPREFGAKWSRYCVWLYDSRQRLYVKDFLAEQMELLTNLRALRDGHISSSHLAPAQGWTVVYRLTRADGSWPVRLLVPVRSCRIEPTPDGSKPAAVVITHLENGKTVVRREDTTKVDLGTALDQCGPVL